MGTGMAGWQHRLVWYWTTPIGRSGWNLHCLVADCVACFAKQHTVTHGLMAGWKLRCKYAPAVCLVKSPNTVVLVYIMCFCEMSHSLVDWPALYVKTRPTIWNLEKIQMAKQKFWLISGLAELSRKTKITAEMRLVANIFGWNTAEPHF